MVGLGGRCVEKTAEASKSAAFVDEKSSRYVSEGREFRAESSSKMPVTSWRDQRQDSNNGSRECWVSSSWQDPPSKPAVAVHQRVSGLGSPGRTVITVLTSGKPRPAMHVRASRRTGQAQGRFRTYTLCSSREGSCVVVLRALCGLWSLFYRILGEI